MWDICLCEVSFNKLQLNIVHLNTLHNCCSLFYKSSYTESGTCGICEKISTSVYVKSISDKNITCKVSLEHPIKFAN